MLRSVVSGALRSGVLLLLGLACASADIVPINPGDFSGHETVIDFSAVPAGAPVNADYLGQGVTFGFGLYGSTETFTATNQSGGVPVTPIFIDFLDPILRAGFDVKTLGSGLIQLTALDTSGNPSSTVAFLVTSDYTFVGVELDSGMTQLWVDEPGILLMQNFRFDPTTVPEPASAVLVSAAILGVLWSWRRRTHCGWKV